MISLQPVDDEVVNVLDAVNMMLPLLASFPLEGFVFNIAADACLTARKQLQTS